MSKSLPAAKVECPLTALVDMIGGRWKVLCLWHLREGQKRFSELRRLMPDVTQKMLTQQLRALENDGLVDREVFAEVPPRVEYSLTPAGQELRGLLYTMTDWAQVHMIRLNTLKASTPAKKLQEIPSERPSPTRVRQNH